MFSTWPTEISVLVASYLECKHISTFGLISAQCARIIKDENSLAWKSIYLNTFSKKDSIVPHFLLPYYQRVFGPKSLGNWKQSCRDRLKYELAMSQVDPRNSYMELCRGYENKIIEEKTYFTYKYELCPQIPRRGADLVFFPENSNCIFYREELDISIFMCFLELTKDTFIQNPNQGLISSIDPYHNFYSFNPHAKLKELLLACFILRKSSFDRNELKKNIFTTTLEPTDENEAIRYRKLKNVPFFENRGHSLVLDGDNVEWAPDYPVKEEDRWGFYSNYRGECLMWGKQFLQMLEEYYWVEHKGELPPSMKENPNYKNFSDLVQ